MHSRRRSSAFTRLLHYFDGTFGNRFQESLPIALVQDAIIEHDDDAGVGFRADQTTHTLAKLQDRFGQ